MSWIKKYESKIFWVLCIGSLVFAVLGAELKRDWLFYIGYGMCASLILSGLLYKIFKKKIKK